MPFSPVFASTLSKPRRSAISDRRGFRIHDRGVRISLRTNTIRSPKPSPTGKVARASPASARRMRDKASLAEQGERQSPPFTQEGGWHGFAVTGGIVHSSKVFLNCHDLTIPQSKIKDFCQLPLHKGAGGAPAPVRLSKILVGDDALIVPWQPSISESPADEKVDDPEYQAQNRKFSFTSYCSTPVGSHTPCPYQTRSYSKPCSGYRRKWKTGLRSAGSYSPHILPEFRFPAPGTGFPRCWR